MLKQIWPKPDMRMLLLLRLQESCHKTKSPLGGNRCSIACIDGSSCSILAGGYSCLH